MKSDIEKQRHSRRTTTGPTLRGVTMRKVLWGQNKKSIWKLCQLGNKWFPLCDFRTSSAYMPISMNNSGVDYFAQNTKFCAFLACLAQPTCPIPARCGTNTEGRGTFEPPPDAVFRSFKPCNSQKQNKRSRVFHRNIPNISNYRFEMMSIL